MIELISTTRCIGCDKCVEVCPMNVFDPEPGGAPVIARKSDCQTCFLCEAYCPADAMFVAPEAHNTVIVNEDELIANGLLGSYRRNLGWSKGDSPKNQMGQLLELQVKLGGRA